MKKETRGGQRPGAGRPATGRQKQNLTITASIETKEKMKALGFSKKAGKLLETIVENLFLLASQADDFEISVRNNVYRTVLNRNIFYGETVRELLDQMQGYNPANDEHRQRYNRLDTMYKCGEFDGELTRVFL